MNVQMFRERRVLNFVNFCFFMYLTLTASKNDDPYKAS